VSKRKIFELPVVLSIIKALNNFYWLYLDVLWSECTLEIVKNSCWTVTIYINRLDLKVKVKIPWYQDVSCGPRSQHTTPWVYWQEEIKLDFHTYVAPRSLTQMQPNLLQRCPPGRQVYIPNLMQIAPAVLFKRPKFHLNFFIFSYTLLRVSVVLLNRLY